MSFAIRLAEPRDLQALESVELLAAQRFDASVLVSSLQKTTVPAQQLIDAQIHGMLWVAATIDQHVVAFLLAEKLDHALHIAEMSVVPSHGRQGIGAALLQAAKHHARDSGYQRVTLTTFAHVPWNAPFYSKQGFREMATSEVGAGLALRMEQERALGLEDRVAMCLIDARSRGQS